MLLYALVHSFIVLILIVVEDGLVPCNESERLVSLIVLILIVVDDGLVLVLKLTSFKKL